MLHITQKSNYLAKVTKLSGVRKHSNADRLQCVKIDGNNVITGTNSKDGDIVIYFPLECQINYDFLRYTNSFSDSNLNRDTSMKGYFSDNCRVRCTKLRGEKSEGYIVKASLLEEWLKERDIKISFNDYIGQEFDTVGNLLICKKFKLVHTNNTEKENKNKNKNKKRSGSRLIKGQFYLSKDTERFEKNAHTFTPESKISISYKLHGCNFSMGKIIVKKKLSWIENLLKRLGVNIVDTEYDVIYASRSVIKNNLLDRHSEFSNDVWGDIAQRYKDALQDGITINGEIVGYTKQGKWIQKHYDYGQEPGTCELYVYRIYYTSPSGNILEFNHDQIVAYCNKYGLKMVPVFFYGKIKELFDIQEGEDFPEKLIENMKSKYTEKQCFMCKNKVPEEGIVVIENDGNNFRALKLKSFSFLERETKLLDNGETNLEDEA
jgi:hypothetical protein